MIPPSADAELFDQRPVERLLARHRRSTYPRERRVGHVRLTIGQDVFDPSLTNASVLLLETIDFRRAVRVLDVFSGSGLYAIHAALAGASYGVAVDISPASIACIRQNAERHHLGGVLESRLGSFGECVAPDERFDLIVANPPLLPGVPRDQLAVSVFDPGLSATLDFIDRLPAHLDRQGRCYLLTSNVLDRLGHDVDRICRLHGLEAVTVAKADLGYETYRVHRISWDPLA